MKNIDKKVIIIGHVGCALSAMKIAELKNTNPDTEIVTVEEAKKRGLTETFEISAPEVFPYQVFVKDEYLNNKLSKRNKRRKEQRKSKK